MSEEKAQVKVYAPQEVYKNGEFNRVEMREDSRMQDGWIKRADYDQLKADFERVVKFYGDSDKMHTYAYECSESKLGYIPDEEDFDYVEGKRNKYLGKLARSLAAKHGIEV